MPQLVVLDRPDLETGIGMGDPQQGSSHTLSGFGTVFDFVSRLGNDVP